MTAGGDLVAQTAAGELRQPRPVVYQDIHGVRHLVAGDYVVDGDGRVRFRLGAYDASRPLVIDPVLSYSTYLGGSDDEGDGLYGAVVGIALDAAGNAYVTGTTSLRRLPTTAGARPALGGDQDVFVTKFLPSGAVLYSTYFGGALRGHRRSIAVDGAGNAYITGRAHGGVCYMRLSTPGVLVAKLDPTGAVVYSFVFGGQPGRHVDRNRDRGRCGGTRRHRASAHWRLPDNGRRLSDLPAAVSVASARRRLRGEDQCSRHRARLSRRISAAARTTRPTPSPSTRRATPTSRAHGSSDFPRSTHCSRR